MALGSKTLTRYSSYLSFAGSTFLLRRERPILFILVINDRCNLKCFYCESKNTGRYELDHATARKALADARGRGHKALVITGGEPMLWRSDGASVRDVVAYARKIGFLDIAIFTNGTVPLRIPGCTYIVTVDGTRETHNAIRDGTYDRILKNARETDSKVIASITLSKTNEGELETAVQNVAETNAFDGITFNILTHEPDVVARHGLSGQERITAIDRLWNLKRRGYPVMLSKSAYKALRANKWKRPVRQIELSAGGRLFTCCRDVVNPDICRICGYSSCVEISQALAGKPSAMMELLKAASGKKYKIPPV